MEAEGCFCFPKWSVPSNYVEGTCAELDMRGLSHPVQLAEPREIKHSQAPQNHEELNMERF